MANSSIDGPFTAFTGYFQTKLRNCNDSMLSISYMRQLSKFYRVVMLLVAGLTTLHVGTASAQAARLCYMTADCDVTMLCYVAPHAAAVPLPAAGVSFKMPLRYLAEVLPTELVDMVPKGTMSDIWRPPRLA